MAPAFGSALETVAVVAAEVLASGMKGSDGHDMSGGREETQERRDLVLEKAKELGFEVIVGKKNTLLLDLDEGQEVNQKIYHWLVETYGPVDLEMWPSKSGRGKHVVLRCSRKADWSEEAACALECALGSDPLRTVLGVRRIELGITKSSRVLFKPTERADPALLESFAALSDEEQRQVFLTSAKIAPPPEPKDPFNGY